jgi:membrane-bound ClpP family serine protease
MNSRCTGVGRAAWIVAGVLALAALVWPAAVLGRQAGTPGTKAPSGPVAVPAARAASKVALISIRGEIDRWTARSVARRIKAAEAAGADAIVFEIDTPGGEALAMLAISSAIKSSAVKNTVAWVNKTAYSAGTVIALACREIVVANGSVMGDALPIEVNILTGFRPIPDAEREKFLGPIMADLIDSARRNGHDEVMVQGFVRRGVELWLVEHRETGRRLFVTAEQFEAATGGYPVRGTPAVPAITGEVDTSKSGPVGPARDTGTSTLSGGVADGASEGTAFVPGSPNITRSLKQEVDQELATRGAISTRPDLTGPEHAGKYTMVEYVASGAGVLTLTTDALLRYAIAAGRIDDEGQLKQFFGASALTRLDETWSEHLARFLSQFYVRGILIAVFLIALFIEMTHPGVVLPGAIAALALVGLFAPLVLVDMSAWWMVAAILLGLVLILLELFVLTGTVITGALGVLLVFGGLVGVAMGGPGNLFPSGGRGADANLGLLTALVSIAAAMGVIWLLARHMGSLPLLNRIILKDAFGQDVDGGGVLAGAEAAPHEQASVGQTGVAITPLRPAGRVQIGDRVVDAVAEMGFIEAGARVRVTEATAFRVSVEPVRAG